MNLLIDIGNTLVKCFIVENGIIIDSMSRDALSIANIETLIDRYPKLSKGIMLSTGLQYDDIYDYLSLQLDSFIKFDHTTKLPIANHYHTPHTLGLDRLAGAVGACSLFPNRKLLVFDFGTAITIDLIENNCFLGGNITLGLQTRFRALHHFTQRLPLCPVEEEPPMFGLTTKQAIQAGIQLGVLAEIESYVLQYKKHKVIFTGGDTLFFAHRIKGSVFVVRNLIALGLNVILEHSLLNENNERY